MCQIWTPIVYEYQPDSGYVPATINFNEVITSLISAQEQYLTEFVESNPNIELVFYQYSESGEKSAEELLYTRYADEFELYRQAVNSLYNLTILYILSGRDQDAKDLLNQHFPPDKAEEYYLFCREEIGYYLFP